MDTLRTFDMDERERQMTVGRHPELAHLGAFVGGAARWGGFGSSGPDSDASKGSAGVELTGIADLLLKASGNVDLIDLDDTAHRLRCVAPSVREGAFRGDPSGDGWFGFAVVVAELRGLADAGAVTVTQYRAAAELLMFVAEWAAETAADEAQPEVAADAKRHQAQSVAQSHRVAGGPARPPPAPVPSSSHQPKRVLVRS